MAHVDVNGPPPVHAPELGPCWLWTAGTTQNGYGIFRVGPELIELTHIYVYKLAVGEIPDGYQVDHVCHDWTVCEVDDEECEHRRCVNPGHLAAVTPKVNNERSNSPSAVNARKDECINGHPFTPENTYHPPGRPQARHCRACADERRAEYERRHQALTGRLGRRRSRAPGPYDVPLFVVD